MNKEDSPPLTYGAAGKVSGGEGRVVLPRSHHVAGQAVVGELRLAVQEGVAAEVDVGVVAGEPSVKDRTRP